MVSNPLQQRNIGPQLINLSQQSNSFHYWNFCVNVVQGYPLILLATTWPFVFGNFYPLRFNPLRSRVPGNCQSPIVPTLWSSLKPRKMANSIQTNLLRHRMGQGLKKKIRLFNMAHFFALCFSAVYAAGSKHSFLNIVSPIAEASLRTI